jgi:hypothetical protein
VRLQPLASSPGSAVGAKRTRTGRRDWPKSVENDPTRHWRLKTLAAQKDCSRQGLREPGYVESTRRRCSSIPAISARMVLSAVLVKCIDPSACLTKHRLHFPSTAGLAPISNEVVTEFQLDKARTDSPLRVLHAQPHRNCSTFRKSHVQKISVPRSLERVRRQLIVTPSLAAIPLDLLRCGIALFR